MNVTNQVFLYNGNTLVHTYSTIQAAVDAAAPGDTIQIGTGTYDENVNVTVNNLTIENVSGDQVTIIGTGGYAGAITIQSGVTDTTIQSSDGVPTNFVLQGSTSGQVGALYLVGGNNNTLINGITAVAAPPGDAGINAVLTGGDLNNVTFKNNVFSGTAGQLVYVNGAESLQNPAEENTNINFLNNTFSGSAPTGPLLGVEASSGTISGNTFSGTSAVELGLAEAGMTVTGNIFSPLSAPLPTIGYFFGNGSYDPQTIEADNTFPQGDEVYVIHGGVRQDGVYSSINAAIENAAAGDTIVIGAGTYDENVVVDKSLTVENAAGAAVTIVGQGGDTGALTVDPNISNVTIKSSDGNPAHFVVEGSQTTGQLAALYLGGDNADIKVNGITTTAAATGDGGLYSVTTGGDLTNVLFANSTFGGTNNTDQLVFIQGTEESQEQDGNVNFNGDIFSGSTTGSLLQMSAPGEVINSTFAGNAQTAITLNESGVNVSNNFFDSLPSSAYFIGDGSYDPTVIESNNIFVPNSGIIILRHDVPQDGVYSSIQAAIDAAIPGDTVLIGPGTYTENVALANGVNVEGDPFGDTFIKGTLSTPTDFDNTTVSNLTVDDTSPTAMLLDMTQTKEVTSSSFSNITFNAEAVSTNYSPAELIGNGQNPVAGTMTLNGTGLAFDDITANANGGDLNQSGFFAYFLFSSTGDASGGPQLLLNEVNLNGDASGQTSGQNNPVTQWNMASDGTDPASVTIDDDSTTSGGGNFYVAGMDYVNINGNTFSNQGVILDGVSNATVTNNLFQNIDGTYSPGNIGTNTNADYEHPGLAIEDAFTTAADSNISITGNFFDNITVPNGAIAFENFTDNANNQIPATIGTLNNINIQGNTFDSSVNPAIYVDPQATGTNTLLPPSIGNDQFIIGTTSNDTITAPSGNTTIYGDPNTINTLVDTGVIAASDFSVVGGLWTVSNGTTTDTLNSINEVTDNNDHTFLLVGDGGYATIQDAVNAATTSGDTILIAPGTYNEQVVVDGTHGASGITIEGVGTGVNVDAPATPTPGALQETAISPVSGNAIDGIFTVSGVNYVKISGLTVNGLEEGDDTYFASGQPGEPSLVGIAYINTTGGSINNVTVEGTRENDAGIGDQQNLGIYVANNTDVLAGDIPTSTEVANLNTISITGSTVENFQKNGITVEYANATISGNTIDGLPDIINAQNGIQINNSTGTVSDNTITNIAYSGTGTNSTGVLAFWNQNVDITGNHFTGPVGLGNTPYVSATAYNVIDSDNGQITDNTSANVDDGIVVQSDQFGNDLTGTWTVSGNTATNVLSNGTNVITGLNGGNGIIFESDPTNASSSFTVDDSGSKTSDVFVLTPGTDDLTGGDSGNNIFVVLQGSDLGAGDMINGGVGTGNTIDFAPSAANDTLTIGSNVKNMQDVDVLGQPTPTQLSNDQLLFTEGTMAESVNATNASNGLTITANNGGDTITGTAHFNDTLIGGTGNDTFIVGTGNDSINGGAGIDTVKGFGAGFSISISNGHWVVSNGTTTDTLTGVEDVVIAGKTYELVDQFGANVGGFQSVQAAINAAPSNGGATILIAPGTYTESYTTASGAAGIYIDKPDLTLQGVDSSGAPITSAASAKLEGATIISGAENDFGANDWIDAGGLGTTIQGLTLQAGPETTNKLLEIWATDVTVENSYLDVDANPATYDTSNGNTLFDPTTGYTGAVAMYFNGQGVINAYDVANNILNEGIVVANGVGNANAGVSPNQIISGNQFQGVFDPTTGEGRYDTLVLNGEVDGPGSWLTAPVQLPTVSGNTNADLTNSTPDIFRWADQNASLAPTTAEVQTIVAGLTDTNSSYAYILDANGNPSLFQRPYDFNGQMPFGEGYNFYVVNSINTLDLAQETGGNNDFPGQRVNMQAGDTIVVQGGPAAVNWSVDINGLKIEPDADSAALTLTLGTQLPDNMAETVQSVTILDYSAGKGANVTVTGNDSGDTITGNDGNDKLTGGAGNDTFNVGSGNNSIDGGTGTNTVKYDATVTSADLTIVNNQWQVSDGTHGADTLNNVQEVTDGTHNIWLVGDGGFATIAQAVAAASAGDTIMIAPGTYTAGATISKELTIIGSGDGKTIIDAGTNSNGLLLSGNIDATDSNTGKATVTIQGIGFTGNQVGVRVASNTILNQLTVENSDFSQNTVNGVGMGSGAPTLANISILNSTFEKNGTSAISGSGDISLFGFTGNALLQNLTISGGVNADEGIQINGRDPNTEDVNNPIGNVTFDNVNVTGSYKKVLVYVQGYTNLNGLDFANSGNGGTVINGSGGWGYALYLDPTAGEGPSNFNTNNATLAPDSVNLTNVSATNNVVYTPAGVALDTVFNGLPQNDTISGLSGGDNLINGAAETAGFSGSGVNTVDFTEKLTASDFQMVDGDWVVTTATEGTDTLQAIEVVKDGANDTFLLVGGGGTYTTPDQAFGSPQHVTGAIIIDTASQDETPTLSFNESLVGKAGAGTVSYTIGDLDDDASGTATFTDSKGQSVQASVTSNGAFNVNLSTLADGTITASLSITDSAGNTQNNVPASNSLSLDQDTGEQAALALTVTDTDVGKNAATAVPFKIVGLDGEDTGMVTFTDSANNTVIVPVNGNQASYTADLHTLTDGTITSSLQVNTDPAGNSFSAVPGTIITLDRDVNESPTLSFASTLIGGTSSVDVKSTAASFNVGGIDPTDDTAVVTFTDVNSKTLTDTVTTNGSHTVDLSSLADGTITATMSVTDPAGNSFNATSSNSATLDQDAGEQAALSLTITDTDVGETAAAALPFTIGGLDSEDTGTVTFKDSNQKPVTVNVNGGQNSYTADLQALADGPITTSLQVNTDSAGNTFTPVVGTPITLDQDVGETPTLSFVNTMIGGPNSIDTKSEAVSFILGGIDSSDDTATVTFTDSMGGQKSDIVHANGTYQVDLSSLADGTVTAAVAVTDTAGNSFSATSSNTATLDQDKGETPTLSFVNTLIGSPTSVDTKSTSVSFMVGGIDSSDDTAVVTFKDVNGKTVPDTVTTDGTHTVDLSGLVDGTITATMTVTDTFGNSFGPTTSSNTATLDQDANEAPTLSFVNTLIGGPTSVDIKSTSVSFMIGGIDPTDDTATVTFKDHNGTTVMDTVSTDGTHTVDLSSLADGTITASVSVTDTAGNSFSATSSNTATLDQDSTEKPTVTVDNSSATPIGSPNVAGVGTVKSTAVPFAVGGFDGDSDESGTLTFSDGTHSVVVTIIAGQVVTGTNNTLTTVNLSSLSDGNITSSLAVSDPAGNSFTANGNPVTLDQDTGEQAALTLTVNNKDVGTAAESAVPFTIAGLDAEDTGTVTFTDSAGHTAAPVSVNGTTSNYTANLTGLADGTITSSLQVNRDATGNTFTAVSGTTITLDTVQPTLTKPTIAGTAQEGQTLTAASNAFQPDDVLSFSWYSSADNFTNPIGVGSTYLLKQTDEGHTIEVKATATNPNGSATLTSTATGTVIEAFPTVVASNANASASQIFTASQLFSASDLDGTPILSYAVEDESTGSSNGFWTLNGVVEPNGAIFTVTTAQLSELSFTAGSASTPVTDTLQVAASDAAGFGSFTSFNIIAARNAPTAAPVVTASNETQLPETILAASSMFTGTPSGGLSIVSYEVEDTTSNSGSWIFNGVTEPANQVIDVTADQLSQLSFQTGFGTDTLMVRANDGNQWGSFATFTISPQPNAAPPVGTTTVMDLEQTGTGVYEYYNIGANGILQAGPLDQISTAISVADVGGFNGSDTADLLTRNTTTGVFTVYDVSNNNVTGSVTLGGVGLDWQVAGFGDFSGNAGETDMLLRNSSGQFEIYDIRNNQITSASSMGQVGTAWQVAGFGDFSTNAGETDMLMRNTGTGAFELYDISHNQLVNAASMGGVGLDWQVAGFGDFSGNANETDMLMRNSNTGAFEVYDIRNNQIANASSMGGVGLQWAVAGFADFSGNANETDMLMRNTLSGAFEVYDISNNTITSANVIGGVGTNWQVAGVAADPPPAAAASTVLSGVTNDPAGGSSISQLTQAMASFASSPGTSSATAPLAQSPMPSAEALSTTTPYNNHPNG